MPPINGIRDDFAGASEEYFRRLYAQLERSVSDAGTSNGCIFRTDSPVPEAGSIGMYIVQTFWTEIDTPMDGWMRRLIDGGLN